MKTSVFLVDDHRILRDGLKMLLEGQGDIVVCGEASDGRAAVKGAVETKPDVIVMDITMPELNGIDATQQILDQLPETHIIILSVHSDSEHIFRAFQAGAQGYLLKESAGEEVVTAVRTVQRGERYLSAKIANTVLDDYIRNRQTNSPLELLSEREREVMQLTVEGNTSNEIAQRLGLSQKTVETYRSRIMEKLKVSDITSLVRFAIKHGLISAE